jgi:hypothetical protein
VAMSGVGHTNTTRKIQEPFPFVGEYPSL